MPDNKKANAGGWPFFNKPFFQKGILVILILLCAGMVYYFTFVKKIHFVYTHFFYIPIVLAGFFWGKKSVWSAVLLGVFLIIPYIFLHLSFCLFIKDILRVVMFIVIAWVIGSLREYSLYNEKKFTDFIEGNPVPTFVIDKDHVITHFNSACGVLTGFSAKEMIGTRNQWMLFYHEKKSVMADFIVDGATREEMDEYYRDIKLSFVKGAYEGEAYNAKPGQDGRWLYVTVAPIKDIEGEVIGAIETMVDITESKRVEKELAFKKAYFQQLFEQSPEAVVMADNEDKIIDANKEFENLFQYLPDEIKGHYINDVIVPEHIVDEASAISNIVFNGGIAKRESVRRRKDGSLVNVSILGCPIIVNNEQVGIYGIYRDITERKQAEKELNLQKAYFQQLFENSPEGIAMLDKEDRIINVNKEFQNLFQYSAEEVQGCYINDLIVLEPLTDEAFKLTDIITGGGFVHKESVRKRRDGSLVNVSILGCPIFVNDELVGGYTIYWDITERKLKEETIKYKAYHDILTGLPNRALFNDRLAMALAQAYRNEEMVAVMFLDLDRFKNINDTLGHAEGDELLINVARRLKGLLRQVDTVGRMSGDEFTILLPDITHPEQAAMIAQRIIDAFRQPFVAKGQELYITTSIGISVYPADGGDVKTLLTSADVAMYRAKEMGRNSYQFFYSGYK